MILRNILTLLCIFFLFGCQQFSGAIKSISTGQLNNVVVISVSGLGSKPTGLKELEDKIKTECPTATLIQSHWTHDLEKELEVWDGQKPLIIVSHSFGGGRSVYLTQRLFFAGKKVNILYLLDPVPPPVEKPDNSLDFTLLQNIKFAECWNRDMWQPFVASSEPIQNLNDGNGNWKNYVVHEFHNDIPSDLGIQTKIIDGIQNSAKIQLGLPLPNLSQLLTVDPKAKNLKIKK